MSHTATKSRSRKVALTGFGIFLLFVLGFAVFFFLNFKTIEVSGPSMEPTFEDGQRLLVSRAYWLVGPVQKGDIVVVRSKSTPGETWIKRVHGVGGQELDLLDMPESWSLAMGPYVVPPDHLFLIGDNRPMSEDSRNLGPFEMNDVLGKVVVARVGGNTASANQP